MCALALTLSNESDAQQGQGTVSKPAGIWPLTPNSKPLGRVVLSWSWGVWVWVVGNQTEFD